MLYGYQLGSVGALLPALPLGEMRFAVNPVDVLERYPLTWCRKTWVALHVAQEFTCSNHITAMHVSLWNLWRVKRVNQLKNISNNQTKCKQKYEAMRNQHMKHLSISAACAKQLVFLQELLFRGWCFHLFRCIVTLWQLNLEAENRPF